MKKAKHLRLALAAFAVVGGIASITTLTSCGESGTTETSVDWATGYAKIILEQNKQSVTGNFTVPQTVELDDGKKLTVSWTSDNEVAKVATTATNNLYTVAVDYLHNQTSEQTVKLTAQLSYEGSKAESTKTFTFKVPKFVVSTIAELDEMAANTQATIKGIITAKEEYSASNKNASVYIQCDGGGLEAYRLACASQDAYDTDLAVGNTIYVSGKKSYYSGLRELASGCTYIYDSSAAKVTPTVTNITERITSGTGVDASLQCNLVKFENLEIVSVGEQDKDSQFSIIVGDPNDKAKQFTVRVSKYFAAKDSALWTEYTGLKLVPGQLISVTGLLSWYNGAQLYPITSGAIVKGDINYASGAASAFASAASSTIESKVLANREISLPSTLASAGLSGDNYKDFTVEWSTTDTAATITSTDVAATDKVEAHKDYTVKFNAVTADTKVSLKVSIKNAAGEVVSYRTISTTVLASVTYSTYANYLAAKDGDTIFVKGTVIAHQYSSSVKKVYIQDTAGNTYYLMFNNKVDNAEWFAIGNTVGFFGTKGTDNQIPCVKSTGFLEYTAGTTAAIVADYTSEFTTNGFTSIADGSLLKCISFEGELTKVSGSSYTVKVGEKEILVYAYVSTKPSLTVGSTVKVTGLLGFYAKGETKTYQVFLLATDAMEDKTPDAKRAEFAAAAVKAQFEGLGTIEEETNVTLSKLYTDEKFTVTLPSGTTTLAFNSKTGVLTVSPTTTETTETITITIGFADSDVTKSIEVSVKSKSDPNKVAVKMVLPTSEVKFTSGTDIAETIFGAGSNVTAVYTQNGKDQGRITTAHMRIYSTDTLVITAATGWKIGSIVVTSDSDKNTTGAKVTVGETTIADTDGDTLNTTATYVINGTTCTFTNTKQVRYLTFVIKLVKAE